MLEITRAPDRGFLNRQRVERGSSRVGYTERTKASPRRIEPVEQPMLGSRGVGNARRLEAHAIDPCAAFGELPLALRAMLRAADRRDLRVGFAGNRIVLADVEGERRRGA